MKIDEIPTVIWWTVTRAGEAARVPGESVNDAAQLAARVAGWPNLDGATVRAGRRDVRPSVGLA